MSRETPQRHPLDQSPSDTPCTRGASRSVAICRQEGSAERPNRIQPSLERAPRRSARSSVHNLGIDTACRVSMARKQAQQTYSSALGTCHMWRMPFLTEKLLVQRRRLAIRVSSGNEGKTRFHGIEDVGDVALSKRWGIFGWERGLETGPNRYQASEKLTFWNMKGKPSWWRVSTQRRRSWLNLPTSTASKVESL